MQVVLHSLSDQLFELDLGQCKQLGDGVALLALRRCSRLASLHLDGTRLTDAVAPGEHDESGELELRPSSPSALSCLTALDLGGCRHVSAAALARLCARLPSLRSLSLAHTSASDATLVAVAENIRPLRALSVEGCAAVTDAALPLLSIGCVDLEVFNLSRCPSVASLAFHHSSHSLVSLSLAHAPNICADALSAVAESCAALTALSLAGCMALDDVSLLSLVVGCPCLRTLHVSHCEQITERGLFYTAMQSASLSELALCGCAAISDSEALQAVEGGCAPLRWLQLPSGDIRHLHEKCSH